MNYLLIILMNVLFLIEGGRYSYDDYNPKNENERWRNTYFLSQRSKNSIVIDDNYFSFRKILIQLDNKSYTYTSGITSLEIKDSSVFIEGKNPLLSQMQNVEHNRKVILDENNRLLVEDNLVSKDDKEHKTTRHFHFHYEWEFIEIIKNKVIFKHKISNKMLEFEDLSNGKITYYCGQEKPFIQGFTSDYEHHKIENPTIEIVNNFKGECLFVCSLSTTNSKEHYIKSKVDKYKKLNCVMFTYTNLNNKNDVKFLSKNIKIKDAIVVNLIYENDHKRAILTLKNSSRRY